MLAWTSAETIERQEDWRVTPQGLEIVQARVSGSASSVQLPTDARLIDGWYRWTPTRSASPDIVFANAGERRICTDGKCENLSAMLGRSLDSQTASISVCDSDVPLPLDATALTARADTFRVGGDSDKAISDYGAALKADPSFVAALYGRATAWRAKGERRRALNDLDAALKIKPDFEMARASRKELFGEIESLGARMPLKQTK